MGRSPPPRARFDLRVLEGGRAEPPPADRARRDVLVVDDDPLSRDLFETVLRRLDPDTIKVHAFDDPQLALAFATSHRVELAVVDLHLGPGRMNGLALIERLRALSSLGERLSVILVTADTEPMVIYEATRLGVPLVLEKAVDLHKFLLRCCALLDIDPPV